MTLSALLSLLERGSVTEIRAAIARPLAVFRRGLSERGRSAPVELEKLGKLYAVTGAHVAALLNARGKGSLDDIELRYLSTALALSPDASYDSDVVREVVSHLSDSSKVDVAQLLEELRSAGAA
jgi:hypothetical protein